MMAIYPWNELGEKGSPFVLTFQQIGIAKAAGIINFVVLTALFLLVTVVYLVQAVCYIH